jgi:hypothetical protein
LRQKIGPFFGNFEDNFSKSLIGSIHYQQTILIHTKRVIFMILPLLFVPLVYGLSSTPDACAAPPDPNYGSASASCSTDKDLQRKTCCWYLPDGVTIRCQSCFVGLSGNPTDCTEVKLSTSTPTPSRLPPGTLENLPTLEQVPSTPTPPLFGENTNVPPSILEQPLTPAPTQQTPNIEQSPQTVTPEITQDDNNGGGGLPSIKNREDLPLDNEITEQPEEDNGQQDSSEGAPTAGPLT